MLKSLIIHLKTTGMCTSNCLSFFFFFICLITIDIEGSFFYWINNINFIKKEFLDYFPFSKKIFLDRYNCAEALFVCFPLLVWCPDSLKKNHAVNKQQTSHCTVNNCTFTSVDLHFISTNHNLVESQFFINMHLDYAVIFPSSDLIPFLKENNLDDSLFLCLSGDVRV